MRALSLLCLLVGCVGQPLDSGHSQPGVDGGGGAGSGSGSGGGAHDGGIVWADGGASGSGSASDCIAPAIPQGDGQHNPGKDCLDGCHNHGFTLAGTLYSGAANNTGYAGATVVITDADGQVMKIVVAQNGNFYTKNALTFPVTVAASSCPASTKMVATSATGHCNTCHAQNGGSAGQAHLP